MRNIPLVPKPTNPKFLDTPIGKIQDVLKDKLPWLNYSFGVVQKLTDHNSKKSTYGKLPKPYPGVHIGSKEYVNVFPDQELGNFSFVDFQDPREVISQSRSNFLVKQKCALVFWFNLDTILGISEDRNLEEIELQILNVLGNDLVIDRGSLEISKVCRDSVNIYKGYDVDEQKSQFLMQPYAGLRFEGVLHYRHLKPC